MNNGTANMASPTVTEAAANTSIKADGAASQQAPIVLSGASLQKKPKPEGVQIAYFPITVRFLDETQPLEIKIDKLITGQELLDRVCEHLQLLEKGYFGLRFDGADNERYWLEAARPVYKQLKQAESRVVHFRVRYYPSSVNLREEITRYQFFLQLRRDLFRGRLLCPLSDAYELAALIVQSELGDYDPDLCKPGYVSEFPLLPRQNAKLEERIAELHKTMVGMTPGEAESRLLTLASRFDTFGLDPFAIRPANENSHALIRNAISLKQSDAAKRDDTASTAGGKTGKTADPPVPTWFIGVNHIGVVLFSSSRATRVFKWAEVAKLSTDGRLFNVQLHVPSEIPASTSFNAGPLLERDEEAQPDANVNGNGTADSADKLSNAENEESAPRSGSKLAKSTSMRETKKERLTRDKPADGNHVEPNTLKAAETNAGGVTVSRAGTLQRNSITSIRFKFGKQKEQKTITYEFRCESAAAAKSLWLIAVDQQAFFTLDSSEEARKLKSAEGFRLFARSAKFRFSGRSERELSEVTAEIKRAPPSFVRTPSTRITTEIRSRRPQSMHLVDAKDEREPLVKPSGLISGAAAAATATTTATTATTAMAAANVEQKSAATENADERIVRAVVTTSVEASSVAKVNPVSARDAAPVATIKEPSQSVVETAVLKTSAPSQLHANQRVEQHSNNNNSSNNVKRGDSNHHSNNSGHKRAAAPVCESTSTVRTLSSALVATLVVLVMLVLFFTILYETDLVEQPAKSVMGVSLRQNSAVSKLADITYKPIKRLAVAFFKSSK